ncbi:MAG: sulfotransferase [Gammaproteobacteria bacterium]
MAIKSVSPESDLDAGLREARHLVGTGDPTGAERLLLDLRERFQDSSRVAMLLAELYCEFHLPDAALPLLNQVLAGNANDAGALARKASALYQLNRAAEAAAIAQALSAADPRNPQHLNDLGVYRTAAGDFDAAARALNAAIELDADAVAAYHNLLEIPGQDIDERQRMRLEALCQSTALDPGAHALANFSLSRHYRRQGNVADEFKHLDAAKGILAELSPWDPAQFGRLVDEVLALTPAALDAARTSRSVVVTPVFVSSMPRAGSTLVEQLLATHPDVGSIGEAGLATRASQAVVAENRGVSPHWWHWLSLENAPDVFAAARLAFDRAIAGCAPATPFAAEKSINNDIMLGLCLLAYPDAFVVHCRRDPLDVCLSAYQAYLPGGIDYNNKLDWLAVRYEQHAALMAHWKSLFPERIVEIDYEDLVEKPERQIAALLGALGIAIPPGGLDLAARDYAVRSASNWQVRQPIYTSSRRRWRRYRQQLEPVMHLHREPANGSGD